MKEASPKQNLVLEWIKKSIQVNNGTGSSGFYDFRSGWSGPYPETTGYLIETLLDWQLTQEVDSCGRWLLSLQNENGSFPSGILDGEKKSAVVFDTGMILLGLAKIYEWKKEEKYKHAATKAIQWLVLQMDDQGVFTHSTYVKGFSPAYHTRVLWALLFSCKILGIHNYQRLLEQSFSTYVNWILPNYSVLQWGFRPNEVALSHTIAYTYRGFLESALLLGRADEILEKMEKVFFLMLGEAGKDKKKIELAASYNNDWEGDFKYRCLVGEAQLACLAFRVFQLNGSKISFELGRQLLLGVERKIFTWPSFTKGGIAGSSPIWGPYQRFRLVNWAAKFYLDASYLEQQILSKNN